MVEVKKRKTGGVPNLTCFDIYITRGDSAYLDFDLVDATGEPITLDAGDEIRCEVRESGNGGKLFFEGLIENNSCWHIRPEDTEDATKSKYVYDIQIEYANGDVITFVPLSDFVLLEESTLIEDGGEGA